MKSLLTFIITALLFLSTTNHANPDVEIPMVTTLDDLKEVAKKINQINDSFGKMEPLERPSENIQGQEADFSNTYAFLNLYHECLQGYEKFLKAKKHQDLFAYLSTGALAANLMVIPWDGVMQVFQYFCLQEHCPPQWTFIKRSIEGNVIEACFNKGFAATCAKKAASYQTTFYLYYKEGCVDNLPSALFNQIIPSQNPTPHMVSSCNLEVALIPSSIEMICLASNILFGCGFMGSYLLSWWQENNLDQYEAALRAFNLTVLDESERNALPPNVAKAYDSALNFYNFITGNSELCNLVLMNRANTRRGSSYFTQCLQKIKNCLGFAHEG